MQTKDLPPAALPDALHPTQEGTLEETIAQAAQMRKLREAEEKQAREEPRVAVHVHPINDLAPRLGRHGAWLSGSGKLVPVDATHGHADVAEALTGLTIRYPADYQQLYRLQWARLTNAPSAIYATYGKEPLTADQMTALRSLSEDTKKPVLLDDDGTITRLCTPAE